MKSCMLMLVDPLVASSLNRIQGGLLPVDNAARFATANHAALRGGFNASSC